MISVAVFIENWTFVIILGQKNETGQNSQFQIIVPRLGKKINNTYKKALQVVDILKKEQCTMIWNWEFCPVSFFWPKMITNVQFSIKTATEIIFEHFWRKIYFWKNFILKFFYTVKLAFFEFFMPFHTALMARVVSCSY
jgi:hypothetical protein